MTQYGARAEPQRQRQDSARLCPAGRRGGVTYAAQAGCHVPSGQQGPARQLRPSCSWPGGLRLWHLPHAQLPTCRLRSGSTCFTPRQWIPSRPLPSALVGVIFVIILLISARSLG